MYKSIGKKTILAFLLSNVLTKNLSCNFLFAGRMKFTSEMVALNKIEGEDFEVPLFDFTEIANATNNFSDHNKLGEGGFGPVYKVITSHNCAYYDLIKPVQIFCSRPQISKRF